MKPAPRRRAALLTAALALVLPLRAPAAHAQIQASALSDAEVEQVRDARISPAGCITLYVKFLDDRTGKIHDLFAKPRRPGRETDTRELMEQFTSIADELSDNLDDYGPRHADLRKALPKILSGADHWTKELNALPDDESYSVARKIALESIRDLHDSATELTTEQDTWFKAHPPSKEKEERNGPIDIPR
ncbi:MAG TPA: hypothetical protein VG714_02865 [Acidobacteriaceae bacterium]|nr:hypothetical protein [Acidobacteriaceae bacterium]